jgi:opacity protein-like surface antigen
VRLALLVLASTACVAPEPPWGTALRAGDASMQVVDPDADYPSEFFAREGFLIGVHAHGAQLGGDFDGETTLVGPDTIFLSDTDPGAGFEVVLGGMQEGSAFELGYTRVTLDGDFAGFEQDVSYRAFGVRGLHYWNANRSVQPLALVGMLIPLVDIEDGSSNGVADGTARLRSGFGFEVGAGFAWRISRRLALELRARSVFQWFGSAEGVNDDEEEIDDDVYAPLYGLSLGFTWIP